MKASKISDLLGKINRAIENPAFPLVSKIELDLLKQHVRDFYEEIETVTDATSSLQPVITETTKKQTEPDSAFTTKRPTIHANDGMLLNEQPVVTKTTEPVKQEIIITAKETPVIDTPEVKAPKTIPAVASSINESIKSGGSLNEKLKATSAVEMHKKLASKPLKELIDLNKRFVLLSELFKGNTDAYTSAIAHIDTLPDYESAQSFISTQLVSNFYWDETKQSTRMFTKLVKMKFGIE
jgi:hypothetical protein